jgi:hypothetical protein
VDEQLPASRQPLFHEPFRLRAVATTVMALGILAATAVGCGDVNAALERLSQAQQISAELHVHFSQAVDASNRAVMADTDEQSVAFAHEAEEATQSVAAGVDALRPVLRGLGYTDETGLLDQFVSRFTAYRELDRRILDLAVQNTNLKAQALSFGDAQREADAVAAALKAVAPLDAGQGRWHVEALAAAATASVREVQALQAPHIANADDAVMMSIEKRMTAEESSARSAIDMLAPLVTPASRAHLTAATAALDRFVALNTQIADLSRRNTNVHSLALALDQRQKVTAPCEETLRALQAALAQRHHTGGR